MRRIDNRSGGAPGFVCAAAALALAITAVPASGTSPRYAQASPPSGTSPRYAQASPPSGTSPRYAQASPPSGTSPRYAQASPPSGTSPRYAQASPAPAETPKGPPAPVDVSGADRIEYDAATQSYTFIGAHVVVTRGDQKLESSEIHYDGAKRRAIIPRHGMLSSPTMGMEADAITADLGARHILAEGAVHGKFLDQGVWATVTAARVEADDRPDLRRVDASGDAVVIRGDQQLRGSRIIYDRTAQHGTVEGRAIAVRGGDRLEADHIEGDLATNDGEATGHVVLDRPETHTHGTADRATYAGRTDTVVLIGHAVVTRDRDSLTGDRVTVNLRTNHAVADGHPKIVAYPSESSP